ncbi:MULTISPECIES: M23 family metallopeptidase [Streptomyces]|uniref:M23 family metallopeptidase n=1 Tax=Streptomyces TaxID=1883 RepID=UPI000F78C62D|nr:MULTISPECIES: M23 family metallopeptidase [Streptomyces]RST00031.1 M23 family metallopeptidase [Streptomyces sp. WAC07149]GLX20552.1 peptidase [Streptomyces lavendulae subsp. lavendulae]GLX28286.1 peptidase [Streptomyces lavendulae subsp. lavendulae]
MSAKRVSTRRTRIAVTATGLGALLALGAGTTAAFADEAPSTLSASAEVAAVQAQAEAQAKAAAAAAKTSLWAKPVDSYTLSATFGKGGSMWAHKHSGQDFAVPTGTKVKAAAAGTVVKAGPNGGGDGPAYGNAIVIKHADNTYSQYAHLSKIQVKIGQKVSAAQQIALSGNTGNSSGPHLHFEIRTTPNYGSAVNPVAFLRNAGVTI